VRRPVPAGTLGEAQVSTCGRYRHSLTRDWTPAGHLPRTVLFIGLNPSVADAHFSDPTCQRETRFAADWGFTRYLKGNLLDWRATRPRDLPRDPELARSPRNLSALLGMGFQAERIVLATGNIPRQFAPLLEETLDVLRATCTPVACLGRTKSGAPRHPLYLRRETPLMAYDRGARHAAE
jgi:hypothetical protein